MSAQPAAACAEFYLRAQYRDRRTVEEAFGLALSDGLHMNAAAPSFVWEWAKGFNTSLIIDLPAYIFTLRPDVLYDDTKKDLRKSARVLTAALGDFFPEIAGKRPALPTDFLSRPDTLARVAANTFHFEKDLLQGQMPLFDPYYEKYAVLLEEMPTEAKKEAHRSARAIFVPPYFLVRSNADPWAQVSLELARHMVHLCDGTVKVFAVLLISPQVLQNPDDIRALADQYGRTGVDGFLLWVNGLREEEADERKLRGVALCVRLLAGTGKPVYKLYGSYFSALLSAKGMRGFSCGLGYAMTKSIYGYGKGRKKPEPQYFVAPLGRTVRWVEAEYLLQRFSFLRCDCAVCHQVVDDGLKNFGEMKRPELSQAHFIHTLRREIAQLGRNGLGATADRLRNLAGELARKGVDASHLTRWCRALEE